MPGFWRRRWDDIRGNFLWHSWSGCSDDAVAYLPKEKILIAGDLVDSPVPFLYGGFPVEQIVTLRNGGTRL
jgi:hypothetical protein